MPHKSNLELFGPVALAYLMDGPKPQTALDGHVPVSGLEQLRSAGIVKRKMFDRVTWLQLGGTWPTMKRRSSRRVREASARVRCCRRIRRSA
jgi:hypothetical protein